MRNADTNTEDHAVLALQALAWVLSDDARAQRLLALTGLVAHDLRSRLTDPSLHQAVLGFLEAHQPDLIACAAALSVKPEHLVPARQEHYL
jgi:Protein of unknown function (DUF3572)